MTRRITPVLVALLLAAGTARSATAASTRLPGTAYPSGAHSTYRGTLSNGEMDCMWNFVCEGNLPNYHSVTQDELHRLDGWGQFAGIRRQGRMWMAFELFASVYAPGANSEGIPWSHLAFTDLVGAISWRGYRARLPHSARLPVPRGGGAITLTERSDAQDLTVMACWSGTVEVEAIVLYDHTPIGVRNLAVADLRKQVITALSLTIQAYAKSGASTR